MSSIAAAKRRRAGVLETTLPPPPIAQTQTNETPKMTIQQAFGIIDGRLLALEKTTSQNDPNLEYMEEMDQKFLMLAEEITAMKDIVLKSQSFTMEVNQHMSQTIGISITENPNTVSTSIADEVGNLRFPYDPSLSAEPK